MRKRIVPILALTIAAVLTACGSGKVSESTEISSIVETIPTETAASGAAASAVTESVADDDSSDLSGEDAAGPASAGTSEEEAGWLESGTEEGGELSSDDSSESSPEMADEEGDQGLSDSGSGDIRKADGYTVVLDPGHSSKVSGDMEPLGPGSSEMKAADSIGTHGNASGLMEYQLNLTVCQKAAAALEQEGYDVILTRIDSENPISCAERAEIANNANADAFIRVHANGADSTSANGAMTICITQNNPYTANTYPECSRLSETLLDEYCKATGRRKERVWYTDSMTGNNWSKVPTTLLEMGYMTNREEDLWMASDEGQTQIVKGIVNGLNAYFGLQ